jgi:hypothetical protein
VQIPSKNYSTKISRKQEIKPPEHTWLVKAALVSFLCFVPGAEPNRSLCYLFLGHWTWILTVSSTLKQIVAETLVVIVLK